MKLRLLAASLLFWLASPAVAEDWWWVGHSGDAPNRVVTYVDRDSISAGKDDGIEVWALNIAERPVLHDQRYLAIRYGFKCRQRLFATLGSVPYDSEGGVLELMEVPASDFTRVVQGSIGESILRAVCGQASGSELRVANPVQHAMNYLLAQSGQSAPAVAQPGEAARGPGLSVGTGFFIGPAGHILTSYHVVSGASRIVCRTVAGQFLPATLVNSSPANDLALLQVNYRSPNYLSFAPTGSVRIGERVFTMGFPAIQRLGLEPRFTEGTVSALSMGNENAFMQISIPIQPGNSGGPVVTERGHVVGIIAATEAVESFFQDTGTLPQNVNWAIKSDYARPLLASVGSAPPRPREDAIALARNSVCLIAAERQPTE